MIFVILVIADHAAEQRIVIEADGGGNVLLWSSIIGGVCAIIAAAVPVTIHYRNKRRCK